MYKCFITFCFRLKTHKMSGFYVGDTYIEVGSTYFGESHQQNTGQTGVHVDRYIKAAQDIAKNPVRRRIPFNVPQAKY